MSSFEGKYCESKSVVFCLSLSESTQLKGIALLLLLCHHLFYVQNGLYDDIMIKGHGLVQEFALVCKVCVALFVFLSGYGLGIQYKDKTLQVFQFYKKRFLKLYKSYWLIWILFVPIGVFLFNRTLDSVYGNHIYEKFLINILGIQDYFGFYGVNPTWWFMSCIIGLYLLFPVILYFVKRFPVVCLVGSFLFLMSPFQASRCLTLYFFPFVLGVVLACKNLNVSCLQKVGGGKILLVVLLIFTMFWRQFGFKFRGLMIDPFFALEIVMLFKIISVKNRYLSKSLEFLGKHSMNIFLFHTFIFFYYMKDIVYATGNPLVIFITLLIICLIITMVIEQIKKLIFIR